MRYNIVCAILVAALAVVASSGTGARVFVEHVERIALPDGWIQNERLAPSENVELLIAVRLTNTAELERQYAKPPR